MGRGKWTGQVGEWTGQVGERTGQVGEWAGGQQCVNGEGGPTVGTPAHGMVRCVRAMCEGGGWALWGRVGPRRCDAGVKHWSLWRNQERQRRVPQHTHPSHCPSAIEY